MKVNLTKSFGRDCARIRSSVPVVHNITNYVAMNFSANSLLAVGASPLMSSEALELRHIAGISSSLVVNIGCVDSVQADVMKQAVGIADRTGKPWVLDPVGVGVSRFRWNVVRELIRCRPSLVRGNAAEIMTICGETVPSGGLDSTVSSDVAVEAAKKVAREFDCVVAVSGPVDYVTDGESVVRVEGGSPLMSRVTACGCVASALCGAFVAVNPDTLNASVNALSLMKEAGSRAASLAGGPGTFPAVFVDMLDKVTKEACILGCE